MTTFLLRIKVQEATLYRNVAKYGSMSPFIEVTWNTQTWSSTVASNHHQAPKWSDYHLFDSSEPSPMILRVLHSTLLLKPQEIGFCTFSVEDLFKGKTKEWVEVSFEGKVVGKVKISVNMYEEKRSEQSTLNTSYTTVDLKEEYLRKVNELELEKEELEFYRRQYKKKQQKLAQERKKYNNVVHEYLKKTTPQVTQESFEEEFYGFSESNKTVLNPNAQKTIYKSLGGQASFDFISFHPAKKRIGKFLTIHENCMESFSSSKADFENEGGTLELRFETCNQFSSPKAIRNSCELNRLETTSEKY